MAAHRRDQARGGRDGVPGRDRHQPHPVRHRRPRPGTGTGRPGPGRWTWSKGRRARWGHRLAHRTRHRLVRSGVAVAALDPFRGYQTALRPACRRRPVLDAFHATKLAQTAVDAVRRRVQQETTGHRGRTEDPLHRIRRVLLRGAENLNAKAYPRLLTGLDAGDGTGRSPPRGSPPRKLRHVYGARDLEQARRRLQTSTGPAPRATSPNCSDSPAPSPPGRTSSWPTSPPAGPATDRPRRPTC